jgi:hypothetical protein
MKTEIYQIFYSEESKIKLDPSFIPLDNSKNERPDWREYWPIRNFLLSNKMEDGVMYGFLSPKFKLKTNIDGSDMISFHESISNEIKLINFSPYFDQAAFYQNIFEQASSLHKNTTDKILRCTSEIYPELKISDMIMTAENTIFCNFFTAEKSFWFKWLTTCERIFKLAEDPDSFLFEDLNSLANHGKESVQFKVFLIERIASLLIHKESIRVIKFNINETEKMNNSITPKIPKMELLKLDSYKISYLKTLNKDYLNLFSELRQAILENSLK